MGARSHVVKTDAIGHSIEQQLRAAGFEFSGQAGATTRLTIVVTVAELRPLTSVMALAEGFRFEQTIRDGG